MSTKGERKELQEKNDPVTESKERMGTVRFYRTMDVVTLLSGIIVLDGAQIIGREPNLDILENGKCKIKRQIQFKRGEVIGLLEVPKMYSEILEPVEEKKVDPKI